MAHLAKITPREVCEYLTTDEFIGLCQAVPGDFEIIAVERDAELNPVVCVELPTHESKYIQVKSWPTLI